MLFALGAATLVTMLLSMSTANIKGEFGDHQVKELAQVVRVGMASALNEINRRRLDSTFTDPDGTGFGSMCRVGTTGSYTVGVPVRTNGSTGRILGYFRTDVYKSGTKKVIRVVAAWPDFTNPKQLAGAEMAISRGRPPFPANPLSLTGDLSAGGAPTLNVGNGAKVIVNDSTYEVPAINVSDTSVYNQVKGSTFAGEFTTLAGADPDSPGNPATGANTITNAPAGVLNDTTLDTIASNIDAYVQAHNSTAEATSLITAATANGATYNATKDELSGSATFGSATDVYFVDVADLDEIKGQINGTGTLVITASTDDTLDILNGGELNWNGNVIVQSSSNSITLEVNGKMRVNGILCIQSKDQGGGDANLVLGHGGGQAGTLNVDGSLLILSDHESDFVTPSGSGLNVKGTFAYMGDNIGLDLGGGAKVNIEGSMALNVPPGASEGLQELRFDGGEAVFGWNRSEFDQSMDMLGAFLDPNDQFLPLAFKGYWEAQPPPNQTLKTIQDAVLDGSNGEEHAN